MASGSLLGTRAHCSERTASSSCPRPERTALGPSRHPHPQHHEGDDTTSEFGMLTAPTPIERQVFELLAVPVPLRPMKPEQSADTDRFPGWGRDQLPA